MDQKLNLLQMNNNLWPCQGHVGVNVLRAIYGEIENGRLVSAAGACFFQIVEWNEEGNLQAGDQPIWQQS